MRVPRPRSLPLGHGAGLVAQAQGAQRRSHRHALLARLFRDLRNVAVEANVELRIEATIKVSFGVVLESRAALRLGIGRDLCERLLEHQPLAVGFEDRRLKDRS